MPARCREERLGRVVALSHEEQVVGSQEEQMVDRVHRDCHERPDHTHNRTHKMNAAPCTLMRTMTERATSKPLTEKTDTGDGGTMRMTFQRTPSPPF